MFRSALGVRLVALAALVLCAPTSWAAAPPWTYVEGGYLNVDVDDLQGSGDNWFVGGAFGGKSWHVIGQYSDGDLSDTFEQRDFRLGLGWHGLLGERADLLAEAYWVRQEVDAPIDILDTEENGYRLSGGVRWRPIKLFEADGFVHYTDVEDSDTSYELRALIYIWRIGIGASYETSDDLDQYNGFVRFNFGAN